MNEAIGLPEHTPRKIIGRRYFFADGTVGPVMVTATEGAANDWAAYIAGVPLSARNEDDRWYLEVAIVGCKLTEQQATGFFGEMPGRVYRR